MSAKLGLLSMFMTALALGLDAHDATGIRHGRGPDMDCVKCHENRPEGTSPDAAKLIAPVRRLCCSCHEAYASLPGWVHGPVATGDCLLCHDPHENRYTSLLRQPAPALCRECHTAEILKSISGHLDESHDRCDACHESHAGANRALLKQGFLDSTTGARYRDEATQRRPQFTSVDPRGSLAGLTGIRVIPALERQELLHRYGLTLEIVKTEVERRLREKGVAILSDEGQPAGQPGLYVCLRAVELRFPGYSSEVCALSGSLDLSLRQTVELVCQPGDMERRLCLATTWDTSAVVVWGVPGIQEGLRNAVEVLADKFSSDYVRANPVRHGNSSADKAGFLEILAPEPSSKTGR